MELFFPLVAGLALGVFVGAAGYRYLLKRDPERLEAWAKELKAASRRLG